MREIEFLLNILIHELPNHVNNGGCICDILDRMYVNMMISFSELNVLYEYLTKNIDENVMKYAVDNGDFNLLIDAIKQSILEV